MPSNCLMFKTWYGLLAWLLLSELLEARELVKSQSFDSGLLSPEHKHFTPPDWLTDKLGKWRRNCKPSLPQVYIYARGVDTYYFCLPSNHYRLLRKQHLSLSQAVRFLVCEIIWLGRKMSFQWGLRPVECKPRATGRFLANLWAYEGRVQRSWSTGPRHYHLGTGIQLCLKPSFGFFSP